MEILISTRLHSDLNELSSDKIGEIYKRTKAKLNIFIKDEKKNFLLFRKIMV